MSSRPEEDFRLRDIAVAAYGPTLLSSIGHGAVLPVLVLHARDLGADVGTAALIVSLFGAGALVSSLPMGAVVARLGERRTLLICGLVDALAMMLAATAWSVAVLAGAMILSGLAWTGFLIARQGFIIDAVPESRRARAMSTLGGTFRVGVFVGPLLGAALIHWFGLPTVFTLAAVTSTLAGLMAQLMPDFGVESRTRERADGFDSVASVLWAHRRVFATLGTVVVVIAASRSVRVGLLPLWADHLGISAVTTSLVFGLTALVDIVMFYPGGALMDRRGRAIVAVPIVLVVALACLALPWVQGVAALSVVLVVIAAANGLGSGIVMTIGADAAPSIGRAQFLGGWRLCGDIGGTGGPLLVSAVTTFAPLASAAVGVGALGVLGAGWVAHWTRRLDRARRLNRS